MTETQGYMRQPRVYSTSENIALVFILSMKLPTKILINFFFPTDRKIENSHAIISRKGQFSHVVFLIMLSNKLPINTQHASVSK